MAQAETPVERRLKKPASRLRRLRFESFDQHLRRIVDAHVEELDDVINEALRVAQESQPRDQAKVVTESSE